MQTSPIVFRHPLAFWSGCLSVAIGVGLHMPMYLMAAPMHFQLAGMPMDASMEIGMALIVAGAVLAGYGLLPRPDRLRRGRLPMANHVRFHVADSAPLNREHAKLAAVLALALTIDVMKPASIAFVMPGMADEYGLGMSTVGYLALSALVGTAAGSLAWGRLADVCGRRAAILLSAILFMGTAICGTMPSFGWNLVMCFMMGAAAGGMLPIAFALMAETIPARHRGWMLVALGGIGTSAGYLAASGAAHLLEPGFSWRALWLLNLPTGALIVLLNRYIPESPRFLAMVGLEHQARAVLSRFAGAAGAVVVDGAADGRDAAVHPVPARSGWKQVMREGYAPVTAALVLCGLGWGLVNFGFVLWLPANLQRLGVDTLAASALMARSALLAIPGIVLVVALYQRWSSFRSLALFVGLSVLALAAFAAIELGELRAEAATLAATVLLLVAISGVIATMLPYAAEIYPVHLRGTGAGLIASGSKLGGVLGAGLGVAGLFDSFAWSALVIGMPMLLAGGMLWRRGVETRGRDLESIQRAVGALE